jgi:PEP-CTERM motif-containing protein
MKALTALFLTGTLIISTVQGTAALPGIDILPNGNFEILGDHDFPPWQFDAGFNAFVNEPGKTASGLNCIFPGGHMWQFLNTEIGQVYRLSYYERGDDPGQSSRDSILNVYWGTQLIATHLENNLDRTWKHFEFLVVGTGLSTQLTFERGPATGLPGVDFIQVITVPEPSILALAVIGLGLFSLRRYRARIIAAQAPQFAPAKAR